MRGLLVLLLVACALGLLSAGALRPPAQDQKPPACIKCKGEGRLVCPEHDKQPEEREYIDEDAVQFCSVIADCPSCAGTGWIPCPQCKVESVLAALEKKKALVSKKRTALKVLDDTMKHALRKAESEHFVLVWEMDKHKVDKKFISPHQGLHLYAANLERLHTDYRALFGLKDSEWREKCRVMVWYLPSDHDAGSTAFCGQNARGGVKLMGVSPTYSVCGNRQNFQNDERLHRNVVHNVTHLLLSAQQPPAWIGNQKNGWADEGLAHFFEDRYWDLCDTYCYQEQNTNTDFKSGRYKLAVRKMVAAGDVPAVAEVFQQNSDTLTLPQQAVSMSYVDYLLFKDAPKFVELVKKLKAKVPGREALQQVYAMNLLDFEAQWRAWVLATYPKQ